MSRTLLIAVGFGGVVAEGFESEADARAVGDVDAVPGVGLAVGADGVVAGKDQAGFVAVGEGVAADGGGGVGVGYEEGGEEEGEELVCGACLGSHCRI